MSDPKLPAVGAGAPRREPLRVTGTLGVFYPSASEGFYGAEQGHVGTYGIMTDTKETQRSSAMVCPYCHAALKERIGAFARVKQIDPVFLMDCVPSTHRVLSCLPCKQFFTQPRQL
jgi:hypothetical protein